MWYWMRQVGVKSAGAVSWPVHVELLYPPVEDPTVRGRRVLGGRLFRGGVTPEQAARLLAEGSPPETRGASEDRDIPATGEETR